MEYGMFEKLAYAYDDCMFDVSYTEWAAYLGRFLRGTSVLEHCCGTGSLTLELLKNGFDVTGADISEEMLMVAADKLRKAAYSPRMACADMAGFRLNKNVDTVVAACDGVNYLLTAEALGNFFRSSYVNLADGGRLLFDISSPYKLEAVLGDNLFYDDAEEQTLFWQNAFDTDTGDITMDITLFVREGRVYHRYDEQHIQHAWKTDEIESALADAGFFLNGLYAFGTERAPEGQDERIQFVADKVKK